MATMLQHYLHPMNLWCWVLRGRLMWVARLYERTLWDKIIRRHLS